MFFKNKPLPNWGQFLSVCLYLPESSCEAACPGNGVRAHVPLLAYFLYWWLIHSEAYWWCSTAELFEEVTGKLQLCVSCICKTVCIFWMYNSKETRKTILKLNGMVFLWEKLIVAVLCFSHFLPSSWTGATLNVRKSLAVAWVRWGTQSLEHCCLAFALLWANSVYWVCVARVQ